MAGERDAPGVVAIPPLIYGAFLLLGLALDFLFPVPVLRNAVQYAIGFSLIAVAFAIVVSSALLFRAAGTNLDVRKPTTAIVASGPYRFSRNPIYLALTLLHVGIAIAADSIWILGSVVPAVIVMHFGVIRREERYLERKFGEAYLSYKRRVRRWI